MQRETGEVCAATGITKQLHRLFIETSRGRRTDAWFGELERFARALEVEFPYLILDARCEMLREDEVICERAVLVAVDMDWEGRRQVFAVEIARRESTTSWRDMLLTL